MKVFVSNKWIYRSERFNLSISAESPLDYCRMHAYTHKESVGFADKSIQRKRKCHSTVGFSIPCQDNFFPHFLVPPTHFIYLIPLICSSFICPFFWLFQESFICVRLFFISVNSPSQAQPHTPLCSVTFLILLFGPSFPTTLGSLLFHGLSVDDRWLTVFPASHFSSKCALIVSQVLLCWNTKVRAIIDVLKNK